MTHESLPSPTSQTKQPTADEIRRSLDTLAVFDAWMDDQLEQLVAAWIHTAAPNAQRPSLKSSLRK